MAAARIRPLSSLTSLPRIYTTGMEKTLSTDVESVERLPTPLQDTGDAGATQSDQRLRELGYKSEFRRDMSLFGVLGISFCAIGILTGMSSAFQTGLFSGGPLGLFWGWNVRILYLTLRSGSHEGPQICSLFMLLIALSLAEICSA